MGLLDDFQVGPPRKPQRKSRLDLWFDGLPDDERTAALAMMADPHWRTTDLYASFSAAGMTIARSHFDRLRRERTWA